MMLVMRDLSFWYLPAAPPIVFRANLAVEPGQRMAIVGGSGAGKSTLLRLCSGLMQIQRRRYGAGRTRLEGRVEYGGVELREPIPAFGYVPQNCTASLMPDRSARDNILLAVSSRGVSAEESARADRLLAATGIAGVGHVSVAALSGGQRQRVAVCRALVTKPSIVFMDEPFASLDSGLRPSMHQLLSELRVESSELAIVMVTHDIEEAVKSADVIFGTRVTHGLPLYRQWRRGEAECSREVIEQWITLK